MEWVAGFERNQWQAWTGIRKLLGELNQRPFKRLPGSRADVFDRLDRPALKPLPKHPYQYTEIKLARVHVDYHLEYDHHFYSVPHTLVRPQIEVRASDHLACLFHQGQPVARHVRARTSGFTTVTAHMPPAHRHHQQWNPKRLLHWASTVGPQTARFIQALLARRDHPEQAYRVWLGLKELCRGYGPDRLEAACARALQIHAYRYQSVKSILAKGLDRILLENPLADTDNPVRDDHENVRGAHYYH